MENTHCCKLTNKKVKEMYDIFPEKEMYKKQEKHEIKEKIEKLNEIKQVMTWYFLFLEELNKPPCLRCLTSLKKIERICEGFCHSIH